MGTIADIGGITLESITEPEADKYLAEGSITQYEYEVLKMAQAKQKEAKIAFIKQLAALNIDKDYSEADVKLS